MAYHILYSETSRKQIRKLHPQIKSVDKISIIEKIGTLSKKRMDEVHEGLKLVLSTLP